MYTLRSNSLRLPTFPFFDNASGVMHKVTKNIEENDNDRRLIASLFGFF